MADFNATRIDPRERLMTIGNQLLDVIYDLDATEAITKAMLDATDDEDKFSEMIKEPGSMEAVLKSITNNLKRDSLVREYVTTRQTIEALTEARQEIDS